jgi:hypothetical protein
VQRPSWRGHLLAVLRAAVMAHLRVREAEQLCIGLPVRELSAQEGCGSAGVHVSQISRICARSPLQEMAEDAIRDVRSSVRRFRWPEVP